MGLCKSRYCILGSSKYSVIVLFLASLAEKIKLIHCQILLIASDGLERYHQEVAFGLRKFNNVIQAVLYIAEI